MYEIKVRNGEVIKSVNDSDHAFIIIDGIEYDLEIVVNHFIKQQSTHSFVTPADILDLESDIDMQKMLEESEADIKQGRVYSTKEVLGKIKSGEL